MIAIDLNEPNLSKKYFTHFGMDKILSDFQFHLNMISSYRDPIE